MGLVVDPVSVRFEEFMKEYAGRTLRDVLNASRRNRSVLQIPLLDSLNDDKAVVSDF